MNAEAFAKEFEKLKGYTVTGAVVSTPEEDTEQVSGLTLEKDGAPDVTAWVQSDPEGNGAGFLAIEEDE
jgi:hypothetical protein|tara:strand:+ start:59 stop:265 length:207 start_codon:yes stop_codon:yes gene_type:complete